MHADYHASFLYAFVVVVVVISASLGSAAARQNPNITL